MHEEHEDSIRKEVEEIERAVQGLSERFSEAVTAILKGTAAVHREIYQQDLKLDKLIDLANAILNQFKTPTATSIGFTFSSQQQGDINVPLTIPANKIGERVYLIGFDSANPPNAGAVLAPGQTVTVVSSDPATVDFTADPTPSLDKEGVQSVWSGTLIIAKPPAQMNVPITVTATVSASTDGTAPGESGTDTVTVTPVVPGVATSVGVLFEDGVSGITGAAKRR